MNDKAVISGERLLLGLCYVRCMAKHTSTVQGPDPVLDRDAMRRDGYQPHPRILRFLFDAKKDGQPVALAWLQLFVWTGKTDEADQMIEYLNLSTSGLDAIHFRIEQVLVRLRVVPIGQEAIRQFLCMIASPEFNAAELLTKKAPVN